MLLEIFIDNGEMIKTNTIVIYKVRHCQKGIEINIAEFREGAAMREWVPAEKVAREFSKPEFESALKDYTFLNRSGKCLTFLKDYTYNLKPEN